GDDTLSGGAGTDTVTYASRTNPVTATLGTASGNGEPGLSESDNLNADIENLTGGSAGDTLTGSSANNTLTGNGGDDTLDGGTGNDNLVGGTGGEINGDTVTYAGRATAVTATIGGTGVV